MNKPVIIFLMLIGSVISLSARAGDVTVKWQNPASYTDIDPAEEDRARFEDHLFKSFNQIFADLALTLPDNYHWEVNVTDLDLAGDARPRAAAGGREMRLMNPNSRPAISFDYTLTDGQGKVVSQGKVDLKDPNYLSRSPRIVGVAVKPFPYEEFMINQWFVQQQSQKIFPVR